jgi:GT2 family glycosyltransferase
MFFKYLESNKKYFNGCEVIIMNDFPLQNITKSVKKIYPEAVVVNNVVNLGFAGNVNRGVLRSKRDYVFLMNSDVVLKDASFINGLKHFESDNELFAVGFSQTEQAGKIVGSNRAYFKNGLINHSHRLISDKKVPTLNFWAEGGSSIFNKKLFIDLGLLDELYNPFYWEDIDLSYRAWKAGYKILYDPQIKVVHNHESTIGKYFDKTKITKIAFRNQLIFHWKNLIDASLLLKHLLNFPRFIFLPGFSDALKILPKILQARKKTIKLFVKSDKEILNQFKQ